MPYDPDSSNEEQDYDDYFGSPRARYQDAVGARVKALLKRWGRVLILPAVYRTMELYFVGKEVTLFLDDGPHRSICAGFSDGELALLIPISNPGGSLFKFRLSKFRCDVSRMKRNGKQWEAHP